MTYGANRYKQTAVSTAHRGDVLIMLYEGAIRYVKKATEAVEAKNIAEKGRCIGKAHDIVNELINSLNFPVGGNLAQDLERLYNYVIEQLLKGNMENSADSLRSAQKVLENLLVGWKGAMDQLRKGGP